MIFCAPFFVPHLGKYKKVVRATRAPKATSNPLPNLLYLLVYILFDRLNLALATLTDLTATRMTVPLYSPIELQPP